MRQANVLGWWPIGFWLAFGQNIVDAQTSNLVKAITTSSRVSATAAGGSFSPAFSADGQILAFLSSANNLVTNDNNRPWLDLFVHRLATGETRLASLNQEGTGGGDASVECFSLSADGRRVVFDTYANDMVPVADTNNRLKTLVRDVADHTTLAVSLSYSNQFVATWRARPSAISQDGRFVLFQSTAGGLETNGYVYRGSYFNYLYVRDLVSNQIHLASQSTNVSGATNQYSVGPSMSADGRLVAFMGYPEMSSAAPNRRAIYVRDLAAGTTTCISTQIARVWPEYEPITKRFHSYQCKLSRDGRCVIFGTWCNSGEIWHYDRQADIITLVATNVPLSRITERPWPPMPLSDDGQVVVYDNGTNLFAWDARTSANQVVDISFDGVTPGNGTAMHAAVSADGSKIVFVSNSTNLVEQTVGLTNGGYQIYLRDLVSGVTHLLSTNALGELNGDYSACYPAINAEGTVVAFDSTDDSLVENDFNHDSDVFTKDLLTGELRLISRAVEGKASATALGSVYGPTVSLSRDGRLVAFTATDGELAPGDTNGFRDAFVRDQQAAVNTLVSVGTDGTLGNLDVISATVSDDGRYVLFSSPSANLFSGQPPQVLPGIHHLYLRDVQYATTVLVASNDASSTPALSPDGRYVAFCSAATNLVDYVAITNGGNYLNVYLYDVQSRTNILVSMHPTIPDGGKGHSRNPRFSPDSQWLLFDSAAPDLDPDQTNNGPACLYLYRLGERACRLVGAATAAGHSFAASFSANSATVVFQTQSNLSTYAVTGERRVVVEIANPPVAYSTLSGDGSRVAFIGTNYLGNPGYGLYVTDLGNGQTTVVATGLVDKAETVRAQFAGDGGWLVFQTRNGLLPADTNGVNDVFLFDLQTSNLVALTSPAAWSSGHSGSVLPELSLDGRTLVLHSFAPDLAANDLNSGGDWLTMQITSDLVETIGRPVIARQPASQTNLDGVVTELRVAVASGANVFYQWWKDGTALTNNGRLTGVDGAALRFNPLVAGDSGGYSVVVSNAYGCQTSVVATLTVVHPPFALQGLTLATGAGGKQVTFGLQSQPFRTYQLLGRPDLTQGTWLPEGPPLSATGEVLWFQLDLGTNTQRYYRVQQVPPP